MSRDLDHDSFSRALVLCELGRLEDAEEALRDALREEPDDPLAHGILALVLLDLDRADEALRSASTTIALAPDLSLGHAARAQALLSLDRFGDAEASAYDAIRVDPESPQAIADGIREADDRRDALVPLGLAHARRFTWRETGRAHLQGYADALA